MSAATNWEDVYRMQTERVEELRRENAALRNEVVRLNNQTMWVCSCGGTDCAGQKENAALRAALEAEMKYQRDLRHDRDRLDSGTIVLPVRGEPVCFVGTDLRAAIDAAIRKAQT